MNIIEWLKVILLGIVEGITEWLPISSTGHMILVDEFIKLNVTADFKNVFEVVIQLGAILAVVVIYFWDLWPFHGKSKAKSKSYFANPSDNKVFAGMQNFVDNYCYLDKIIMWFKIVVSCLPAAVIGLAFNDWIVGGSSDHMKGQDIVVSATQMLLFLPDLSHPDRFLSQKSHVSVTASQAPAVLDEMCDRS